MLAMKVDATVENKPACTPRKTYEHHDWRKYEKLKLTKASMGSKSSLYLRKTIAVRAGFTLEPIIEPDVDSADRFKDIRKEGTPCSKHRTKKETRLGEVRRRGEVSWAYALGFKVVSPMTRDVLQIAGEKFKEKLAFGGL